jgi:hypothetical protein
MHHQGENMGASAYIGRVGALAVALGLGTAVVTGQGIASAAPEAGSTDAEPSAAADADNGQDSDTTPASPTADPPTAAAATQPTQKNRLSPRTDVTSTANSVLSSLTRAADHGVALSTGGALTSKRANPDKVEPQDTEPQEAKAVVQADAKPAAKKSSDRPATNPVERVVRRVPTITPDIQSPRVAAHIEKTTTAPEPAAITQRVSANIQQRAVQTSSFTTAVLDTAPKLMAAAETARNVEKPTLRRVLTNLASALGLGALASDTPGVPLGTPIVMALLALGTRRESESVTTLRKTAAVGNTPVAALALTNTPTAAVAAVPTDPSTSYPVTPVAVSPNTSIITKLTGPGGLNDTQSRFGVGGTDLGIMWDNGITDNPNTTVVEQHQVLILFGDTFSSSTPVRTGVWRNNMMFRSSDNILSNGIYVQDGSIPVQGTTADDFSGAPLVYNSELNQNIFKQVIANERYAAGNDITIIPTSAISVSYPNEYGSRQYASFMDVRSWDTPGRWTTNYSGIAFSDDNGVTWHVARESIRPAAAGRSTMPYVAGNQNFQQMAFVKPPADSADAAAGYIYAYGTPSGRGGTVYLSRVKQAQILDQTKYEYWDGAKWVANKPSAAKPVLPGTTTSSFFGMVKNTTYPSVGEMSVQYNEYEKQYIMLYQDSNNNIVIRKANRPEGPWSAPTVLVTSSTMPGLYAPMIHPWSSTTNVPESDRQYLYWNVSTWGDYQVTTMRTDLSKV